MILRQEESSLLSRPHIHSKERGIERESIINNQMQQRRGIPSNHVPQTQNIGWGNVRDKEQQPTHSDSKMPRILHSITKIRKKKQQKERYRIGEQTTRTGGNTYAPINVTRGIEGRKSRATEAMRNSGDFGGIAKLTETTHWPPDPIIIEKP